MRIRLKVQLKINGNIELSSKSLKKDNSLELFKPIYNYFYSTKNILIKI